MYQLYVQGVEVQGPLATYMRGVRSGRLKHAGSAMYLQPLMSMMVSFRISWVFLEHWAPSVQGVSK